MTTMTPNRLSAAPVHHLATGANPASSATLPTPSASWLRRALALDSAGSLATGLVQISATAWLAAFTGLPAALLLATGYFLLAFGAAAAWTASRQHPPVAIVWLFVIGNVAWAFLSAGLWAWGDGHTGWGQAFIAINIAFVLLMAALEHTGLRRMV